MKTTLVQQRLNTKITFLNRIANWALHSAYFPVSDLEHKGLGNHYTFSLGDNVMPITERPEDDEHRLVPQVTDFKVLLDIEHRDSPLISCDPVKVLTSRTIGAYSLVPRFRVHVDVHRPYEYYNNELLNNYDTDWRGKTITEILQFPIIGTLHVEDYLNFTNYVRGTYARAFIWGAKSNPLIFKNILTSSFSNLNVHAEDIYSLMRISVSVKFEYHFFQDVNWCDVLYNTTCLTSYNRQLVTKAIYGARLLTPETKKENQRGPMNYFGSLLALLQQGYHYNGEPFPEEKINQIFRNAAYAV